ncbi:hypothetical protein [Catenovulum sediminis]|uniref:Uncharacterized protein n=1 Tax=Catenovulum sediminis TaxID=1740262 RepID=A0ABV1RH91_9ALTE
MATLIQKTVGSSYLHFAGYAPVVAANTEFEIEYLFRFDNSNDYGRVVGNGSGYVSRILHWHNGSDAIRITDHSGTSYDFSPSYTHTDLVKFKFVRGADMKISLHIDDVFVEKSNVVISGEFRFEYFFRQSNAVANVHMSLGYFKVDVGGIPFLHFSPDDSDTSNTGSQPVVVELINGYDAAGQSFATDGTVWSVEPSGPVRLTRSLSLLTGFKQRKVNNISLLSGVRERKQRETTLQSGFKRRFKNDTTLQTDLLERLGRTINLRSQMRERLSNDTAIQFNLAALNTSRLSNSIELVASFRERVSRNVDINIKILERKINNVAITAGLLNRLKNDIAMISAFRNKRAVDITISVSMLQRLESGILIQFGVEGDRHPRIHLNQTTPPKVQLAYVASESEIIQITPTSPTKIQLQ